MKSNSLSDLNLINVLLFQFDYEETYSILVFGGGGAVALWLAAAVVGAIDSIPVVITFLLCMNMPFYDAC